MFHVKPKFPSKSLMKISITFTLVMISQVLYSQKEKDFSIGLSSDLSFGGEFNNFATSIRISYNILDRIRVVPTYSYYLKKENQKMSSLSFDFNYLLPNISTKIFPKSNEETIIIYPIAGFFILNYFNPPIVCKACNTEMNNMSSNYESKFGFNFGVGAEYKIPSTTKFLKKSSLFFESKYITIENIYRPLFSCGLFYKLYK